MNVSKLIKNTSIKFGTSGARGLAEDFSQNVCVAFAMAFIEHGKRCGKLSDDNLCVAIGIDNRPSSYEMAQGVATGLIALGLDYKFHGVLPTPALAYAAMQRGEACIMVTGSHIPFDRNGLKFYYPEGEISKFDEQDILSQYIELPDELSAPELIECESATNTYINRYLNYFSELNLTDKRIGVYTHSSAGRELYLRLLQQVGATVVELGRSYTFVPIDTEAVSKEDQQTAKIWANELNLDAIISTDGDGDRPLVADECGNWLRGDVLGLIVSQFLKIEALSVPINCNSAIELSGCFKQVARTKIGSPFVIEAFVQLQKQHKKVAGFEANGGYLLASDIDEDGKLLSALPTRDALLPILVVLTQLAKLPISKMMPGLPKRYTASGKVEHVPSYVGLAFLKALQSDTERLLAELDITYRVIEFDNTDGTRLILSNKDIVHFRCSGNAPEMRCYVESDSGKRAETLLYCLKNKLSYLTEQAATTK
ncbi:phosphomannomutase [Pseudoalteromonas phenolica]|uniref:Phosphomannomutase n=1 Tax=Pseudoalteromonas phenolica TaxID=161398 RepID=A0A0S2K608_9GAMM|nr:phosphomannomutase [Pseudoalteromonas phenolica]ALO43930.1 phosphomannomutase [Pseudoalteromonas phenolica]MBE0356901.1 phosphomannomutase [Pseudoalteromonas phenolica O-BC30]